MPKLRAVLFDVFGTLLDVQSVADRADALFPGHGTRLAAAWRDKQLEYTRLRTLSGRYVPFSQLTDEALQVTADALGLPLDAASRGLLMHEYGRLKVFDDVLSSLERLKQRDLTLGVLSNGDPGLLDDALEGAGLGEYFDLVLSADAVRAYKTAPAVYELGERSLRHPAAECLFISANGWDACGAAWYGYTSFWVNRGRLPAERLGVTPAGSGPSLDHAVEFLVRSSSSSS
jgi:2-haloacid dehalogenase